MKKTVLLIALFLFVGCEDEQEKDKHGCLDSQACNYDSEATIENNSCLYGIDCNGDCGGTAVVDSCGTCDSNSENDCVQDCADEWGGDAVVDECGVCSGEGLPCNVCYSTHVQPIFNADCVSCHGGQNNLFLNSYSSVMAGNSNNGPVIFPNDADNSLLWQYINSDYMPMGGSLTSEQKTTIAQWINEGAQNN